MPGNPWDEVGNSYPSCERILVRGGIDGVPAGSVPVVRDATLTGDGTTTTPLGVVEGLTLGTLTGFGSLSIKRDTWLGSATGLVLQALNVLSSRYILAFRDSLAATKWTIDSDYNGTRTFRIRDQVGLIDVVQVNQLTTGFVSLGTTYGGFEYDNTTQQLRWFTNGLNRVLLDAATGLQVLVPAAFSGAVNVVGALSENGVRVVSTASGGITKTGAGVAITAAGITRAMLAADAIQAGSAVTPASLAANTNDWASGAAAGQVVRASSTGAFNLTGIGALAADSTINLVNVGGFSITLTNDDPLSLAANRILTPGGVSSLMSAQGCVTIWYDGASSRWRMLARG